MNLYLDDDTAERRLVTLLTQAGHRVVRPADVQLMGTSDAQHLIHAIRHALVLVTRNHDDFLDLHEVVQAKPARTLVILIIRFEMIPYGISCARFRAIAALEAAGVPVANQVYILNHWR